MIEGGCLVDGGSFQLIQCCDSADIIQVCHQIEGVACNLRTLQLVAFQLLVLVICSRTALNRSICKRKTLDELSGCIEDEEVEAIDQVLIEIF